MPETKREFKDPFDATWRERVVVLGSLALILIIAYAIGMSFARAKTLELTALVPTSFFVAGKFLPLWGVSGKSQFGAYELGIVIWIMDTCSVLLIVYALEGLYFIKSLKRGLDKVQRNARLVLTAYPRFRKGAIVGLILFVCFPIAGTGSIGAAFLGILLGIHRARLIAAVSAGGLLGGMTMAFLAVNFSAALSDFEALQREPRLKYVFIGVVVLVLGGVLWWASRAYKRMLANAERELAASGELEKFDAN